MAHMNITTTLNLPYVTPQHPFKGTLYFPFKGSLNPSPTKQSWGELVQGWRQHPSHLGQPAAARRALGRRRSLEPGPWQAEYTYVYASFDAYMYMYIYIYMKRYIYVYVGTYIYIRIYASIRTNKSVQV